ncbi:hypothetical protein R1flu_012153 [Riccia fluitans]|uniref:Uncharacterized protein n=1 Tax=Riccia fluitans TaxID=41844 RepID=A0ABD1ZA50_9MARC
MSESATTESEESVETLPKVVTPTTKPPPPPVFKPSPATDNDTYFDRYFKPLNGDIIISNKLEYEPKDPKAKKSKKGHPPPPPVLTKRAVALYNDEFDQMQLRPGDFILRRGMFELHKKPGAGYQEIHEWCWKDVDMATIHVYWPNFHSKANWFKVARFPLVYSLGPILDPDVFRTCRDFKEDPNMKESTGDIIIRRLKIQDPTRPWGWTFDAWQLQEYWDEKTLLTGDIVVQACGKYFQPFKGSWEEKEPIFKLKEALFRMEVDCAWRDPGSVKKWYYGGQDVFCYKVKVNDPSITQERFRAVPKPGDILITQGENLLRPLCDKNYSKGGYVQMYNDKRFFYPGDPPLKAVNVKGAGNMAIRFGHFDRHWHWTPLPCLQLFHFHEKECAWYTLGPVLLTYKWMVAPDYRFEQRPLELNSVVHSLIPKEGDIIIRKPRPPAPKLPNPLIEKELRTDSYFQDARSQSKLDPFWERIMKIVPYNSKAIWKSPLVQGDCLLRAGIEPAGPLSTAKYNATAELYMLVLDHWGRLVWIFRGYDKVFFGDPQVELYYDDRLPQDNETKPELGPNRDLSIPSQVPRLVSTRFRPSANLKRRVDDVLIERSVWNNPGSRMVSPGEFRYLITLHEPDELPYMEEIPSKQERDVQNEELWIPYQEDNNEKPKRKESKSRGEDDKNKRTNKEESSTEGPQEDYKEEEQPPEVPKDINGKDVQPGLAFSTQFSQEVIDDEFDDEDEHRKLNQEEKSIPSLGKEVESRKASTKQEAMLRAQQVQEEEEKANQELSNKQNTGRKRSRIWNKEVESRKDSAQHEVILTAQHPNQDEKPNQIKTRNPSAKNEAILKEQHTDEEQKSNQVESKKVSSKHEAIMSQQNIIEEKSNELESRKASTKHESILRMQNPNQEEKSTQIESRKASTKQEAKILNEEEMSKQMETRKTSTKQEASILNEEEKSKQMETRKASTKQQAILKAQNLQDEGKSNEESTTVMTTN